MSNWAVNTSHRQWRYRHWFVGKLIPESALHVGSGAGNERTDSLCLRDGEERLFIPGSSLRGVLRSFLEKTFRSHKDAVASLFGPAPQDPVMRTSEGWASRVVFHDLYPEVLPPTRVRDGVGIRRDRLAHRHRLKYDFETIPPGTPFRFSLYFNTSDGTLARDKGLILAALEELRNVRLPIGGITSRGVGGCRLEVEGVYCLDLSDPDCLIALLKADHPEELPAAYRQDYDSYCSPENVVPLLPATNWLQIELELNIEEPVVVNTQYPDEDFDVTFIRTDRYHNSDWTHTVFLPGSSVKGALRSRAEMILRTLVPSPNRPVACDPTDPDESCSAYLKQREEEKQRRGQRLKLADVERGQCQICSLFGSAYYAGRVSLQDAFPVGNVTLKPFDWVAINRFTGGAVEGKKFNGQLATAGTFRAVLFGRDLLEERGNPDGGLGHLALMAHLLKDLHCTDIPIGYGKFKGFGKLRAHIREIAIGCGIDHPVYQLFKGMGFTPRPGPYWQVFSITPEHLYEGTGLRLSGPVRRLVKRLDRDFTEWVWRLSNQQELAP